MNDWSVCKVSVNSKKQDDVDHDGGLLMGLVAVGLVIVSHVVDWKYMHQVDYSIHTDGSRAEIAVTRGSLRHTGW